MREAKKGMNGNKSALYRLSNRRNLEKIWKEYKPRAINSAAGVDGLTARKFDENSVGSIRSLSCQLRDGYVYSRLRGVRVPKTDPTNFRIICIPTIQDRIVQKAVLNEIEAKAKRLGIANEVSFGFIKNTEHVKRGTGSARDAAMKHRRLKPWAFKADIEAFFDRIDRKSLILDFSKAFSLKSLTPLVVGAVGCEVDDSNPQIKRVLNDNKILAGSGLRQGMPLSPTLSNFVLRHFDKAFTDRKFDLVRYADDLLVFGSSRGECEEIASFAKSELNKLGLKVSEAKTMICEPNEAVEFLGMELAPKGPAGAYALRISERQKSSIRDQFTNFHDLDFVQKEGLDAYSLAKRLRHMAQGYRSAYSAAENFEEIEQQFAQWQQNCFVKIYDKIFGAGSVKRLSIQQRNFLMV